MTMSPVALARKVAALERKVAALGSPQLAYSSLHDAFVNEYETILDEATGEVVTDQLSSTFGRQFDGTHGLTVVAGPPPPEPTAPTIVSVPGGVELTWDGTWGTDPTIVAPSDWTHCEVHLSTDAGLHGIFFTTKRMEITSARGGTVFIPVGGGVEVYGWLVARTAAGKYALGPLAGPVAGGKLTADDLDVDLGTQVFFGSTDPATTGTVGAGSLWLKEPENVPYRREVSDLGVGSWVELRDPGIASALSQAAAAQSTANTKAQVFPQASPPPTTGRTLGDIWVDIDDDGKQYIWDGQWTPRLIGSGSIKPNSLVARDVLATGSIDGAQISGTAINGKTITGAIVQTASTGKRIILDSTNGLRGINTAGAVKTQLDTDGILTAVDAKLSGRLDAGQVTLTPNALGEANYSGDQRPVRGGMKWTSGNAATSWEDPSLTVVPVGESPELAGGDVVLLAGYDKAFDVNPVALLLRAHLAFLGRMDVRDDINGAPIAGVKIDTLNEAVTVTGRKSNVPLGIIIEQTHTTTLNGVAGAEARMQGPHNITSVRLLRGRAYSAIYAGIASAAGANTGRHQVAIRVAAANVTPTTTSPVASLALVWTAIAGGQGQSTINTDGQYFTVSADMDLAFHLFMANSNATIVPSLIPPQVAASGAKHGITIEDVGAATASTRVLL